MSDSIGNKNTVNSPHVDSPELTVLHTVACNQRADDDFAASSLRCQCAEECRQRDKIIPATSWSGWAVAKSVECLKRSFRIAAWVADSTAGSVRTLGHVSRMAEICDRAEVVSFDVFDTLLYRTVEPPDYLKRLAANFATERYSSRGYPVTSELFLHVRNDSEARQRRLAQRSQLDPECKLSEIIHEMLRRLFGSVVADADTALLVDSEIEIEGRHLRVAGGIHETLDLLKKRGKRVIVTSDTYLEQAHLRKLFVHLGIGHWIDAVYASSEYGLGKYSGRLFQQILQTEGIEPRQLIHVGDTYQSDVRGALKARVPAVFLFDVERLRRRRRVAREMAAVVPNRPAVGRDSHQRTDPYLPPVSAERQPELYRIGHDFLGPAFTVFVLDVVQEANRIGAADIYYLAREGCLFRQLHEILTTRNPALRNVKPLRHHYLYVSRLATSLPAARRMSERELHLASYRDPHATLSECIAAFGLDPTDFSDLPADLGSRDEVAKANLFANAEFSHRMSERSQAARACLRAYLVQEGFFHQPQQVKVLVDIGWNATIQANLTQAFEDDPEFPLVVGYYFGRRYRHEDFLVSPRSLFMPGRLFDQKRPAGSQHAIGHCLELFELAAAAPHGATLGYEHDLVTNRVTPILAKEGAELTDEQRLLQTGILDYANRFADNQRCGVVDLVALRAQSIDKLAQLILRPTRAQADSLKNLSHSLDWGWNQRRPLISPRITPWMIFAPRRFYDALKESYWLEGCMRVSRIPGALFGLAVARRVLRLGALAARLGHAVNHYF